MALVFLVESINPIRTPLGSTGRSKVNQAQYIQAHDKQLDCYIPHGDALSILKNTCNLYKARNDSCNGNRNQNNRTTMVRLVVGVFSSLVVHDSSLKDWVYKRRYTLSYNAFWYYLYESAMRKMCCSCFTLWISPVVSPKPASLADWQMEYDASHTH